MMCAGLPAVPKYSSSSQWYRIGVRWDTAARFLHFNIYNRAVGQTSHVNARKAAYPHSGKCSPHWATELEVRGLIGSPKAKLT